VYCTSLTVIWQCFGGPYVNILYITEHLLKQKLQDHAHWVGLLLLLLIWFR